ncbi:alkaline shock response membrane anchor protein AmaP [Nocardia australiensis]|uniref:alkaline shock response membrane anchor protein AmaP n=1 Tax=Nocardia australiensis TaxID=2887191 RepID=UPI001D13F50F|nr:alkaline shock response membrane anchor protein AmaP [Nocardia australiensis]
MSRINRPATVNRTVIGLTGLLLLAAGGLAIAAHYGRLAWVDEGRTLVPGTAAPPTWVLWAAVACAVLIGLLCLRWLIAQLFRMPRTVTWQLTTEKSAGATLLESSTAAAPVVVDIESYEGVRSASAWLAGARWTPELHLVVTAELDADLPELRRHILGHAVTRLREALEVEVIPVTMELRFADEKRPAAEQQTARVH